MARIFQPLLFLLARCTRHELIRTIELLRAELEMTRRRVPQKHIVLNAEEKERLITLGKELGPAMKQTLSIVSYGTYLRWLRDRREGKPVKKSRAGSARQNNSGNSSYGWVKKPAGATLALWGNSRN